LMKSRNIKIELLKDFLNDKRQPKHYTKKIKRLTTYTK
jgi:hypothetical protein